ncbi:hypothetical protein CRX42_09150 [Pseudomonas jessenii]|jgi:hypothetical protein|uniref:Uncharacterized protein n=1 Tax=Pseudomonas jessenii TaxID=77298 RepID=A0A2W0EYR7_PSEJE|nr:MULTISPECIES: hypothetical protein [Pseudomonas]PYY70875.1 hypothetical protein CRX42_09150 [Pseudomonas jessenii]WPN27612.1 hypothetical protein QMK54_17365 [Pseudomonas sp. P5_109]
MYTPDEARNSAFKILWEEEDFSYLAILYCDANGDIGYTPIKTDNTLIHIEHEAWPNIDQVRFNSLESLLDALESNGFKQVPGEMDSIELPWSSYPDLPTTLQEQLNEPGMFMLDRRYKFQFKFDAFAPGPSAFPISVDGDSVYLQKGLISAMDEIRFANIDSLIKALGTYGDNGRVLDWNISNRLVRTPKITWQH